MTKHINRYELHDLKTLRIRKRGSARTLELSGDQLLEASNGSEFNDINILPEFQQFQQLLIRLKTKKDFEIELDFEE